MTSYPVTIATDSHQTCIKMCLRDMCTATEMAGLDNDSSWKNSRKTLCGFQAVDKTRIGTDRTDKTWIGSDPTHKTWIGSNSIKETHIHSLKVGALQIPIKNGQVVSLDQDEEEISRK